MASMFEAYSIGIRLSLLGNVMGEFSALSRAIKASGGDVDALQKRLDKIKGQAATGLGMIGAGIAIAAAFKPAVNEAIKLEQAVNRIKALNLGGAATAQLLASADALAKNGQYGMSRAQAVALVAETQGVTANAEHTQEILPGLAKMKFGIETYMASHGHGEGQGDAADAQFQAVVKAMEMRGLMRNFTAEKAQSLEDLFTKAFVATVGQVKPTDFLAMMKTGGVAAKTLSPDFLLALGHVMQEMGGGRTGTSIMSAYQNLVGGRSTQQVAEQLAKLGLVNPGDLKYSTTGKLLKLAPGALKDSELFQSDPLAYLNTRILPAIAKSLHISTKDLDNDKYRDKILAQLNTMFSNRTASSLFTQLFMDRQNLAQYMAQTQGVAGVNQLNDMAQKSTVGDISKAQAEFNTLLGDLGKSVLPPLNEVLHQIVPMMQSFDDWMAKNPRLTKVVIDGLLGLSAALVVAGGITTLGAGVQMLGLALRLTNAGGILRIAGAVGQFGKAFMLSEVGGIATFTSNVSKFGAGVTATGVAMQALGVIGAAAAGWALGHMMSEDLNSDSAKYTGGRAQSWSEYLQHKFTKFNASTGQQDWDFFGSFSKTDAQVAGDIDAQAAWQRKNGFSPVRPGARTNPVQVNSSLYIDQDGLRKIANGVTTHQANEMGGPQTGASGFDSSMGAPQMGWGGIGM